MKGCSQMKNKVYDYLDREKNVENIAKRAFNKVMSMFKYHGLPDTIPQDELEKRLILNGYVCVAPADGGLYAFDGGLGGKPDVYNRPTIFTVSNPALNLTKEFKIGEECIIIKNDSSAIGLTPILTKFAFLVNENELSQYVALVNTRLQLILSASDDKTRESAKQFLARVQEGKLGTIADNAFLESLKIHFLSTQSTNTLNNLITHNQYLKACFLNDIGLNSNTQLKKERLITSEVENNSSSLYPVVDDMINCRRDALEKVNELFGTSIKVEFNSSWDYRLFQGASIHNLEEEVDKGDIQDEENSGVDTESSRVLTKNDSDDTQDFRESDNDTSKGNISAIKSNERVADDGRKATDEVTGGQNDREGRGGAVDEKEVENEKEKTESDETDSETATTETTEQKETDEKPQLHDSVEEKEEKKK